MAQKKKAVKKSKAAKPPAKQKKAPAVKSKAEAKKETPVEKKKAVVKKESPAKKTKAVTEKKPAAPVIITESEAATKNKTTGTMANKELPEEANNKANEKNAEIKINAEELKSQPVSDEQKKDLEKRTESKDQLNDLIKTRFSPMFSNVVKKKTKTPAAAPAAAESKEDVVAAGNAPLDDKDVVTPVEVSNDDAAPASDSPEKSEGFSFGSFSFDWKKMEGGPFEELAKFFREHEIPKKEKPVEDDGPMVIVADFTLPYHCCEDYTCEDICYSDDELVMLPIPPFAKDDFAVVRKDSWVDIYPDMNDSHLFKDYIVVKEIEEGLSFVATNGGKVTTDKKGERPHFTYTPPGKPINPPAKGGGFSDSFIYTLLNAKNGLTDTATVWIEVADAVPTFSMTKTTFCRTDAPWPVTVDPVGRDWSEIEVTGAVKTTDGSGNPTWKFDPKGAVIGENILELKLNDQQVGTIKVTVTETVADFKTVGELIDYDKTLKKGTIIIHDLSVNALGYQWSWSVMGSPPGPLESGVIAPDSNGVVLLPTNGISSSGKDFKIHVRLNTNSKEGCVDEEEHDVQIKWLVPTDKPLGSIEIVKKYSILIPDFVDKIDLEFRKQIDPNNQFFPDLILLMDKTGAQVSDPAKIAIIDNGGFDSTIAEVGKNIRNLLPANTNPNQVFRDESYRETVYHEAVLAFALMTIRDSDIGTKMASTMNAVVESISILIEADYFPAGLEIEEFKNLSQEIDGSRIGLEATYNNIKRMLGIS